MLGMNTEFNPRFLRRYANLSEVIQDSVKNYIKDVKAKNFPNKEEEYK
jgi:3-methyl-2-oxobutanoate hydroxymethyltransferase